MRRGVTQAAWRRVDRAEALGNVAEARCRAERALVIDCGDEAGLRRVMTLQCQAGDRAAALRTHETFARNLDEDWAAKPEPETQALVDRIRAGRVSGGPKPGLMSPVDPPRVATIASVETGAASGLVEPPLLMDAVPSSITPRDQPESIRGMRWRPHRLWWLFIGATTAVVVGMAIVALAGPRSGTRLIKRDRVLVAPLDNRTGTPALEPLGALAAEWIADGLLRSADLALFQAKREGGDRICVFQQQGYIYSPTLGSERPPAGGE